MQSIFIVLILISGLDLSKPRRLKKHCSPLFGCQSTTQLPWIPGRTNCVLPEYPDNGKWAIFDGPRKWPGEIVPAKTILQYQCDSQFKLLPEIEISVCHRFWNVVPICLKTCPSLPTTQTLHISCELDNKSTSCIDPYDGSVARVACISSMFFKYMKCINGSWDASLPPCSECIFQFPDINDETITTIVPGEFPFMARIDYPDAYRYPCVGALISTCYVVASMECVFIGPETVRLGHFSHNINDSIVQDVKIKEVIYDKMQSVNGIVLIKLVKPVTVNTYVQPISIIESNTVDARVISIGSIVYKYFENLNRTTMLNTTIYDCQKKHFKTFDDKQVCLTWTQPTNASDVLPRNGVYITENREIPCTYNLVGMFYSAPPKQVILAEKVYPYLKWIKNVVRETC